MFGERTRPGCGRQRPADDDLFDEGVKQERGARVLPRKICFVT